MSQILPYETRSTVPFVLMTDTHVLQHQHGVNVLLEGFALQAGYSLSFGLRGGPRRLDREQELISGIF